jgi:PH/SEC7 domain-containing protein
MIQQRIKEGGQFLDRSSAGGQQDVLSVSADGGIVMGYFSGITNGLSDASNSVYVKGAPEIAFWARYYSCFHYFMVAFL